MRMVRVHFRSFFSFFITWIDEDTDQTGRRLVRTRIICVPSICIVNKERVDSHSLSKMCFLKKSFQQRYFHPGSSRRMMNPEERNPIKKIYSWSTLAPKVSGWINNVSVQVYDSKND